MQLLSLAFLLLWLVLSAKVYEEDADNGVILSVAEGLLVAAIAFFVAFLFLYLLATAIGGSL
jgi:hypothetical protein